MLAFFIDHWFHFFFFGGSPPNPSPVWYERAVWGNVVAVLPLAILGGIGFFYHHIVVKRLHSTHDAHLRQILAALDPESDTETRLDQIADAVDETTPGGIKTVLEAIEGKKIKPASKRTGKAVE